MTSNKFYQYLHMRCMYAIKKSCHQAKVLDFLATIGKSIFAESIKVKLMLKTGLTYSIKPINVIKSNELTFRTIEI